MNVVEPDDSERGDFYLWREGKDIILVTGAGWSSLVQVSPHPELDEWAVICRGIIEDRLAPGSTQSPDGGAVKAVI